MRYHINAFMVFRKKKKNYSIKLVKNSALLFLLLVAFQTGYTQKKGNGFKKALGLNKVDVFEDKFEKSITYRMNGNKVKINGAVGNSIAKGVVGLMTKNPTISILTTRLQLENHITSDGTEELAVILKVSVDDDARFWVQEGESLIFLLDGQRFVLSTEGDYNSEAGFDSSGDFNSKTHARYPILLNDLERILTAEKVEFRIMQGSLIDDEGQARDKRASSLEGVFSKKNIKAWKKFYEDYIINKPKDFGQS